MLIFNYLFYVDCAILIVYFNYNSKLSKSQDSQVSCAGSVMANFEKQPGNCNAVLILGQSYIRRLMD